MGAFCLVGVAHGSRGSNQATSVGFLVSEHLPGVSLADAILGPSVMRHDCVVILLLGVAVRVGHQCWTLSCSWNYLSILEVCARGISGLQRPHQLTGVLGREGETSLDSHGMRLHWNAGHQPFRKKD